MAILWISQLRVNSVEHGGNAIIIANAAVIVSLDDDAAA
jgi:hypothetical protein